MSEETNDPPYRVRIIAPGWIDYARTHDPILVYLNRWRCLNAKQRRENRRAGKRLMAAAKPMRTGVIRGVGL